MPPCLRLCIMRLNNEVTQSFVRLRATRTIDLISEIETLPGIIDTPMRILALRRNAKSSATDFADILARDASLATKVLAMANSSWYAPAQPVTRLSHAVAMIGMSNLFTLVFGLSLSSIYPKLSIPQAEIDQFWRVSMLKSIAARNLALQACPEHCEDVALLALLQDIALPVMFSADVSIWNETKILLDGPAALGRDEKLYGHTHAEFGAMIAKKLGLPEVIESSIAMHHDRPALERLLDNRAQARCLTFAAALPHTSGQFRSREPSAYADSLFDGTPTLDDESRAFDLLRDISNQFRDV
ncbi:MAG TPA: HDOD domain-containing protein, partial [Tepidisphaeraceae bacterium]|nr:HDOD domain-containing protein [Tepidisphaeraceae bacterium]